MPPAATARRSRAQNELDVTIGRDCEEALGTGRIEGLLPEYRVIELGKRIGDCGRKLEGDRCRLDAVALADEKLILKHQPQASEGVGKRRLPLGRVGQSTARLLGGDLDLLLYPGRDGTTVLYEDDGLTYRCEQGEAARTRLEWKQAEGVLTLGARRGAYPGMAKSRAIRAHLMRAGNSALSVSSGVAVHYAGRAKRIILGT